MVLGQSQGYEAAHSVTGIPQSAFGVRVLRRVLLVSKALSSARNHGLNRTSLAGISLAHHIVESVSGAA